MSKKITKVIGLVIVSPMIGFSLFVWGKITKDLFIKASQDNGCLTLLAMAVIGGVLYAYLWAAGATRRTTRDVISDN